MTIEDDLGPRGAEVIDLCTEPGETRAVGRASRRSGWRRGALSLAVLQSKHEVEPEQRSFRHVILTRYNIASRKTSPFNKGLDEGWLTHRTELFRTFCFPSVAAQSEKNFVWIILLHSRTPAHIREMFDDLCQICPQMRPFYVPVCTTRVVQSIVKHYVDAEYLITSRLDNDDALALNFVESVQKAFRPAELEFINFSNVACYDHKDRAFYTQVKHSNPFISLVEEVTATPKTVTFLKHRRARKAFKVREIHTRSPMALTVTHERNLVNTATGCIASPSEMRKHFALDIEFPEEPSGLLIRQLAYSLKLRLRRSLRKLRPGGS